MDVSIYRGRGKRSIDFVAALLALVILSPVLLVTAICVAIVLGRPVLFRQERPGFRGQTFWIVKFRTMSDDRGADGELLPDSERLGAFGKFLRCASLDELPELWNVLLGDMSLVGPRPLLVEYLPLYDARQSRRHEVRPGITGWAQVNGRNTVTWEEKFEMDVAYVDGVSPSLDLKILWLTVKAILAREGISAAGSVTMPRFAGTKR